MGTLDRLKKGRKDLFEKVSKDLESGNKFEKEKDDRYWTLTIDKKTGTGAAIIRILPPVHESDELPWVREYSYGFKNAKTGKWYINKSLRTIGKDDPVGELNREEWEAATTEAEKNVVRARKQRTNFHSNIQVIKDPANPDNNGKEFLFRYGKAIFDMMMAKAKPEVDELTGEAPDPVQVWDAWDGCNLRLKAKTKDKFLNYDDSEWEKPSELCGGDEEEMEELLSKCHPLAPIVDPKNFKSYDDLKKELNKVLGIGQPEKPASSGGKKSVLDDGGDGLDDDDTDDKPVKETPPARKKVTPAKEEKPEKKVERKPVKEETPDDDDDDDLSFFKKVMNDPD